MKVLVIAGSPHRAGTTALLIERFAQGVAERGGEVTVFRAGEKRIHPCVGCMACRDSDRGCVYADDMEELNPLLRTADVVVFATPLFYFGMSAQLKAVVDRFFAQNDALRGMRKRVVVLAACGDTDTWAFDALRSHFETICRYLHWELIGSCYAQGVYLRAELEKTDYPEQAYRLGRQIAAP